MLAKHLFIQIIEPETRFFGNLNKAVFKQGVGNPRHHIRPPRHVHRVEFEREHVVHRRCGMHRRQASNGPPNCLILRKILSTLQGFSPKMRLLSINAYVFDEASRTSPNPEIPWLVSMRKMVHRLGAPSMSTNRISVILNSPGLEQVLNIGIPRFCYSTTTVIVLSAVGNKVKDAVTVLPPTSTVAV